jgi:hypothetical protein
VWPPYISRQPTNADRLVARLKRDHPEIAGFGSNGMWLARNWGGLRNSVNRCPYAAQPAQHSVGRVAAGGSIKLYINIFVVQLDQAVL